MHALARIPNLSESDFSEHPVWRDSHGLTGTFRTFYSAERISKVWKILSATRGVANIKLGDSRTRIHRLPNRSFAWVTVDFCFETCSLPKTSNIGQLFLTPAPNGEWKIWMITTYLERMLGYPSVDELIPPTADRIRENSAIPDRKQAQFDAVVVGAGQAGLSVGGRLKALGVSYVVIDAIRTVGDNWKTRYDSTRLHTTREFAHLPFGRTFTPEYQEYLTKDDVAKGFVEWADKFDINVWLSTCLENGIWDKVHKRYTLYINHAGKRVTITCRHVVMATGGYGPKRTYPEYDGREIFKGHVIHAEDYKNSHEWKGQAGVVVGTANTAHDIAEDMVETGMKSVWMIQRGRTFVIPASHFKRYSDRLYNAHTPTATADRLSYTLPWAITRQIAQALLHPMAAAEPERYDALKKANFKVTQYGDLVYNLTVRRGGHYMDVGCSNLISNGMVKVKSDSLPVRYKPDGLECADGTFIPADVVVFATGFSGTLGEMVEDLFGEEIGTKFGTFWGFNDEGEIRNAFVPTEQPGMWAAAGTVGHSRYHSRFIALHIAADIAGIPFEVYSQ
ncbi:hypothetical protein BJY01DRAFT_243125 [Aspergillus pseudoustus]|uniref:Monooxygenase n=1 Tax=Aspergillus pseudoustus TaxID=1810923 RepID=A0ABR4KVX4_9EURO